MINWNPIPNLRDKAIQIHAMTGAITTLGVDLLTPKLAIALSALLLVMTIKEVWAYFHPSKYNVDLSHAVATGLGGLLATAFMKLLV